MTENEKNAKNLKLTWNQTLTIFILLFSNFVEGILVLFLNSFFPQTAFAKGLDETTVGFILSSFQISAIISSFLFKYLATFMSSKTMFLYLFILSGAILIPFMFVNHIQSKIYFSIICFICRIVQGFCCFGISFSSINIITSDFKSIMSTLYGSVKLLYAAGIATAPFLSATAFTYFGFKGPFILISTIVFITFAISVYSLRPSHTQIHPTPQSNDETVQDNTSDDSAFQKTIKVPEMLLLSISLTNVAIHISFIEFILTTYLMDMFGFSVMKAGSFLMITPSVFSIFCPITGYFIDRKGYAMTSFFTGSIIMISALIFIGPAPFLNIKQNTTLLIPMLAINGIAISLQFVPAIAVAHKILRLRNIELSKSWEYHINIATLMPFYLGSLIGPTFGSFIYQRTNFAWTNFVLAAIFAICSVVSATFFFSVVKRKQDKTELEKLIN